MSAADAWPTQLPDLKSALRERIAQIPSGRVATFRDLALALGSERATIWVAATVLDGSALAGAPVHRVVRSSGELASRNEEQKRVQRRRLAREGLASDGARVDLATCRWAEFSEDRPLESLRSVQRAAERAVRIEPLARWPGFVAGVDVSYSRPDWGVAAYVLVEWSSRQVVWSTVESGPVQFPYISTFLSFREIPLLRQVCARAERDGKLADVILVDGQGRLHPEQMGIAAHLGVALGRATVGVGKTLLCGRVNLDGMATGDMRAVEHGGENVAVAVRTRGKRPLFVSPGQGCTLPEAARLVQGLVGNHRLPEPTHWAHVLSRKAAQTGG